MHQVEPSAPQADLSATALAWQPTPLTQLSVVQALLSSQTLALPAQAPSAQVSCTVQTSPSSQLAVLAVDAQPFWLSQTSLVQLLLSSHETSLPAQVPASQLSPWVQALLSSQGRPFCNGGKVQLPVLGSQATPKHGPGAVQTLGLPGAQAPCWQTSPSVQGLSSVQGTPLKATWVQPAARSQLSLVQGLPSSQASKVPGTQVPASQVSSTVQTLPSASQGLPLCSGGLPQLPSVPQLSAVQLLPSSQLPSSTVPSQSLSMPSQTSLVGVPAEHVSGSPGLVQVAVPRQVSSWPSCVSLAVQDAEKPRFTALSLQRHWPLPPSGPTGTHWVMLVPLMSIDGLHSAPLGQSVSCKHGLPQVSGPSPPSRQRAPVRPGGLQSLWLAQGLHRRAQAEMQAWTKSEPKGNAAQTVPLGQASEQVLAHCLPAGVSRQSVVSQSSAATQGQPAAPGQPTGLATSSLLSPLRSIAPASPAVAASWSVPPLDWPSPAALPTSVPPPPPPNVPSPKFSEIES